MSYGFRPFHLKLSKRYLKSANEGKGSTTVTKLAVLGNTLAVFSIVTALAIRAGFQEQFLDTLLGSEPHVTIEHVEKANNGKTITNINEVFSGINGLRNIRAAYPVVSGTAIVALDGKDSGASVVGLRDSDFADLPVFDSVKQEVGNRSIEGKTVSVGVELAEKLGLGIGSEVKLISAATMNNINRQKAVAARHGVTQDQLSNYGGSRSGTNSPSAGSSEGSSYRVGHIFKTGNSAVDAARLYMDVEEASDFLNKKGGADTIDIVLKDVGNTTAVQLELFQRLPDYYYVETWKEKSEKILSAMALQDKALFIILSVLILISGLNIISGLVTLVSSKSSDIGILRTMGVKRAAIKRIFFLSGATIGVFGAVSGAILGVVFSLNIEHVLDFIDYVFGADPELKNISTITLTAKIRPLDLAIAVLGSMLVSFVITLVPASKAANMNPIDALRDE